MVKDFVEAITTGKTPIVDVRKALAMTLPGIYALESAKNGGAVTKIKYPWDK
jgi:hypothetical protein